MKLSELVAYRNALEQFNVPTVQRSASLELENILHRVESVPVELGNFKQELGQNFKSIHDSFINFNNTLSRLKQEVKTAIEIAEKPYFAESYRMYEQEMCYESNDHILNRRMPMSPETEQTISTRIQSYSDWRYPGMMIRPGLENFMRHMVSFDPLYIVDREHALLEPAINKFPEEYQRRLRCYYMNEYTDDDILGKIPNSQFGIVVAFNFFNFKPFEVLKQYLQEIYTKLRPGGVLCMTINDCDRAFCVALTEAHFTCYTPGSLVRELAINIGYEPVFNWNDNGNLTWVEFRKPGLLNTIKGGQTLAKTVNKPIAKSK